jgi:hypothetical protein
VLLDTGASFSMISAAVVDRWAERGFPVVGGATGRAAMGSAGIDGGRMVRVPELRWGGLTFTNVGFVERPAGTFEGWMSGMMSAPIVGALAGNVFSHCRLDIDVPKHRVDVRADTTDLGGDLDVVGLALSRLKDEFVVSGVSEGAAPTTAAAVLRGDVVVAVDGEPTPPTFAGVAWSRRRVANAHASTRRSTARSRGRDHASPLIRDHRHDPNPPPRK